MENGLAQPSLTQELLDEYRGAPNSHEEFIIKWSANAIYGGGADTTVSASISFYYWMLQYPEIHRRAQAEIDAVVGTDRLPTFADREYLPYVNALIKEVLRCSPIIPINLPHKGIEDTIYNGYLIPKGALILVNIYSLLHDPDTYKNPDEFRPERYLGESPELDPSNMVFGFGRRYVLFPFLPTFFGFLLHTCSPLQSMSGPRASRSHPLLNNCELSLRLRRPSPYRTRWQTH